MTQISWKSYNAKLITAIMQCANHVKMVYACYQYHADIILWDVAVCLKVMTAYVLHNFTLSQSETWSQNSQTCTQGILTGIRHKTHVCITFRGTFHFTSDTARVHLNNYYSQLTLECNVKVVCHEHHLKLNYALKVSHLYPVSTSSSNDILFTATYLSPNQSGMQWCSCIHKVIPLLANNILQTLAYDQYFLETTDPLVA